MLITDSILTTCTKALASLLTLSRSCAIHTKKNTIVAYYMVLEINARDESLILLKDSILYISKLLLTSSFLNVLKCFFLHF